MYLDLGEYDAAEKLVRKGLGLVKGSDDKDIKKEFEETLEMIKKAR